jgi:Transglycosylase SLT domain
MKAFRALSIFLLVLTGVSFVVDKREKEKGDDSKEKKESPELVLLKDASAQNRNYIYDRQIYDNGCDTLNQIVFWRKVMNLSKDSAYLNIAKERRILLKLATKDWNIKSEEQKGIFRDSLRMVFGLSDSARILLTEGKSFFYDFWKAYPNLHTGIEVFRNNNVDPWYAQAILLIESPGRLQKSNVGAYGPFQLMKSVATMYGLKVNRKVDERANLEKSAYAAAMLMKNICIPKTKMLLDTLGIAYKESDLWFRLLTLHSYHAGFGNVKAAVETTGLKSGGLELIRTLWYTQAKGFKTASQTYSQVALAAMMEMDARLADKLLALTTP